MEGVYKVHFLIRTNFHCTPYIDEKIFVGTPFLQTKKGTSYLKNSANRNAKPLYHWLPCPSSFSKIPRLNCFDDFMMLCKTNTEGQNWLPSYSKHFTVKQV